jgi:hypothetical protein
METEKDKVGNKNNHSRKEKTKEEPSKNNTNEEKDKKPKEKRDASIKEALIGIGEELNQQYKIASASYWRCS